MNPTVFLATNNPKKLIELRRILAEQHLDLEVVGIDAVAPYPAPDETEWTFEGNALIKARAGMAHSGLPTIADDSGLMIDALNGMPGVRSSRWAGPEHEDVANLELVLRQIDDVPRERRTAQFVAVMALVMPDGFSATVRGTMGGRIALAPRGARGFGYDPVFMADDQIVEEGARPRTNAELRPEEKDAISHRSRAIRAIVPVLCEALGLPVPEPAPEPPRPVTRKCSEPPVM
ncbi:MAG: non-canonical purine NTP pyrophosphatase [Actinomycetia bacterium]|nr:non-canonical purine NTP pyrophosphatase [Actinomycetes bacterium]